MGYSGVSQGPRGGNEAKKNLSSYKVGQGWE